MFETEWVARCKSRGALGLDCGFGFAQCSCFFEFALGGGWVYGAGFFGGHFLCREWVWLGLVVVLVDKGLRSVWLTREL